MPEYRPNGQPARGLITVLTNLMAGDGVTIGTDTYLFGTDFTGENEARAAVSLTAAIRGEGGDTYYATSNTVFRDYSAYLVGKAIVVFSTAPGTSGNTIVLTTNIPSRISVSGSGTLSGGVAAGANAGDFGPGQAPTFFATQTSASGATYVVLASVVCRVVTITNNTGVVIDVQRDGAGTAFPLPASTSKSFVVRANANELSIKRDDSSNTQVTVNWEA